MEEMMNVPVDAEAKEEPSALPFEPGPLPECSGRSYIWQGFMIYFAMWVYGAILIMHAFPILTPDSYLAESTSNEIQISLMLRYLPNMRPTMIIMGVVLIVLGAAVILTRFLLARYHRRALPVFFAVSAADIILPLLFPLALHIALQPIMLMEWWELYVMFWTPVFFDDLLYPLIVRLVLLICHIVYYHKRRIDFCN